ncbi:12238_t:CDS:2, partial [Gigaspora margarita]
FTNYCSGKRCSSRTGKKLLAIFDEHVRSTTIRKFWDSIKSDKDRVRQDLLQENKEDSNVLEEHINENDKILSKRRQNMNELKQTPQQKKIRSYSPTCSEEYSSSDSEFVPISLTNVFRKILEESGENKVKAIESESVTHLSRAVELESNNLDETTEFGPNNINEETELEHKNLDDATKLDTSTLTDEKPNNILLDSEIKSIKFSNGNVIDKLHVNCDEEVLEFLDKFDNVTDLKSLRRRLDENVFRTLYIKRHDIHHNKLKEMLNVPGNSSPKLDGKGLLRSLGTEILAQEDGPLSPRDLHQEQSYPEGILILRVLSHIK